MAKMASNAPPTHEQRPLSFFVANDKDMHAFLRSKLSPNLVFLRLVAGLHGQTVSTVAPGTAIEVYSAAAVAATGALPELEKRLALARATKADALRAIAAEQVRIGRSKLCVCVCACAF